MKEKSKIIRHHKNEREKKGMNIKERKNHLKKDESRKKLK